MTGMLLENKRILVVEDEYMLADELANELRGSGAVVVGPAGRIEQAVELIRSEPRLDAAVLDINLGGQSIFPIAERLADDAVPFLFVTGYDAAAIPPRYADIIRCEKPVGLNRLRRALGEIIRGADAAPAAIG